MVKAIFFDFWGTLVENGTYSPLKQSYRILRVRKPYPEFVQLFEQAYMTKTYEDQQQAFTAVCDAFGVPAKPFVIDKLIGVWNKNRLLAHVYPETEEVLKGLREKGVKVVLISNCSQNNVDAFMEAHNMNDWFDKVYLSFEIGKLKTDGLIQHALEQEGLQPEEVLFVGDSIESDMKGAEQAGVKAILVDRKGRREYDPKILKLNELYSFLEEQ